MDVGGEDLRQVGMQHLSHGRTGDVHALLGQSALVQVLARMLGVGEVDVGDDVDDAAVGLFGQALVLASVARLHVEDGDVETFCADHRQARVGVAQHKHGVGTRGCHQLVRRVDDVAAGGAEVVTDGVEIHFGLGKTQVAEEDAIEVVVVVLARMGEDDVEILAALGDDRRQADNLWAGAHDDQQLKLAVVGKMDISEVSFHMVCLFYQRKARNSRNYF